MARTQNLDGLLWLLRLARWAAPKDARGSAAQVVLGARRLGALLPKDPRWARYAAPLAPRGLPRFALAAYANPSRLAATVAAVGGVTLLEALRSRRR